MYEGYIFAWNQEVSWVKLGSSRKQVVIKIIHLRKIKEKLSKVDTRFYVIRQYA